MRNGSCSHGNSYEWEGPSNRRNCLNEELPVAMGIWCIVRKSMVRVILIGSLNKQNTWMYFWLCCWYSICRVSLTDNALTSSSTDLQLHPLLQKTLPLPFCFFLIPSHTHIVPHSQCVPGIVVRWIGRCLPVGCQLSVWCKHLWVLPCIS